MSGALALVLGASIAAGATVDVDGTAELRSTFFPAEEETLGVYSVVARPTLRGALEREGAVAEASYTPQLSAVAPSQNLVLLLHTATAGAEAPLDRRLRVRARAIGAVGDLDPGSAQRELFTSLGVLDRDQALSFASGTFEAALIARITPLLTLEVGGSIVGTGSPTGPSVAPDALVIRPVHTESFGTRSTLLLSRRDALLIDASLRAATIVGERGGDDARALGVLAAAGYRRQLARGAAVEARAGALTAVADAGDGKGRFLLVLPTADARLGASFDLGGGAALDGDLTVGLTPLTDPLGALLEDRLLVQAGGGMRFSRDTSLRASLFLAAPLFTFGGTSVAQAGTGASATFSWSFARDAALQVGALSQTRLLPREPERPPTLAVEVSFVAGVSGTFNAFHSGSRPRGSDSRPGRGIGEVGIGRAPPPQQGPLESEPPPLPQEPEPEQIPPELVPPPVSPPLTFEPPPDPRRRRRTNPTSSTPSATPSPDEEPRRGGRRGASDSAEPGDEGRDERESSDRSSEKAP